MRTVWNYGLGMPLRCSLRGRDSARGVFGVRKDGAIGATSLIQVIRISAVQGAIKGVVMRDRLAPPQKASDLRARRQAVIEGLRRLSSLDRTTLHASVSWAVIERSVFDIGAPARIGGKPSSNTSSPCHPYHNLHEFLSADSDALQEHAEAIGLDADYIVESLDRAGLLALVSPEREAA